MSITGYHPCTPNQISYLSTYSEDTPENIDNINYIYSAFQQKGDVSSNSYPNYQSVNLTNSLPKINARIYSDDSSYNFNISTDTTSFISIGPGAVLIENKLIEITESNTLYVDSSNSYLTYVGLTDNFTNPLAIAVHYDADSTSFESGPKLGLIDSSSFDSNKMCAIWILDVTKTSGLITNIEYQLSDYSGSIFNSIHQVFVPKPININGGLI